MLSEAETAALAERVAAIVTDNLSGAIGERLAKVENHLELIAAGLATLRVSQRDMDTRLTAVRQTQRDVVARWQQSFDRLKQIEKQFDGDGLATAFQDLVQTIMDRPRFDAQLRDMISKTITVSVPEIVRHINTVLQKPYLTSREAAKLIGVTPQHLSAMRARKGGPKFSGTGKWVRYKRTDVDIWIAGLPTNDDDVSGK